MNSEQKSNLARTAIFMLSSDYDLRMNVFFKTPGLTESLVYMPDMERYENECGTVCCLAGHGPPALLNRIEGESRWIDYIERTFIGGGDNYLLFNFLFSGTWPNEKFETAARVLALLEEREEYKECMGRNAIGRMRFGTDFDTRESLIERLQEFVLQ